LKQKLLASREIRHRLPSLSHENLRERGAHSGELVAGVADEHTGLAHGAIADGDALDEPGGAGRHGRAPLPDSSEPSEGEKRKRSARRRQGGKGRTVLLASWWRLVRDFSAKRVKRGHMLLTSLAREATCVLSLFIFLSLPCLLLIIYWYMKQTLGEDIISTLGPILR
jgi:hypothetical protein